MAWEDHQQRIESSISDCGSLRLTRWWGKFDPDYAIKCLIADPTGGAVSHGSVLFDYRQAMVDIDFNSAEMITQKILDLKRPHRDKAAFLVSNDLTFGLARMYEAVAQPIFEETLVALNLQKALEFLSVSEDIYNACESSLTDIQMPKA